LWDLATPESKCVINWLCTTVVYRFACELISVLKNTNGSGI